MSRGNNDIEISRGKKERKKIGVQGKILTSLATAVIPFLSSFAGINGNPFVVARHRWKSAHRRLKCRLMAIIRHPGNEHFCGGPGDSSSFILSSSCCVRKYERRPALHRGGNRVIVTFSLISFFLSLPPSFFFFFFFLFAVGEGWCRFVGNIIIRSSGTNLLLFFFDDIFLIFL